MNLLKNNNVRLICLVICGTIMISGCAQLKELVAKTSEFFTGNKRVPIVYTKAPNDKRLMTAKVKNITIQTFKGDSDNAQFTAKVTANIAALKYGGSSCYTIIAPEELSTLGVDKTNWENNLLNMPSNQRDTLKKTVDTIISGTVNRPQTTQQTVQRERTNYKKCIKYNSEKKCIEHQKYNINCTKKTSNVEFTAKAISIDSAQVIFSKAYTGTSSSEHCPDSQTAGRTDFQAESIALSSAFKQFSTDIAPYSTSESPRIRTSDSSKLEDNPEAYKLFEQARSFIGDKRYGIACDTYKKATSIFDASPSLNFNLGICMERKGDFKTAVAYYEKADQLYQNLEKESDEEIVSRLTIARNMEQNQLLVAKACQ